MQDNEIIKGLEMCSNIQCKWCPLVKTDYCTQYLIGEAFDLIKRQQAEIERYKDLEEQGRLIELPCKVGDTVYILEQYFSCGKYEILMGFFDTVDDILENKENFGKTVFLTKEEAEAKLKEMVGVNNDR